MTTLLRTRLAFHGTTPLYDRQNLARILDILEARGFTPAEAGLDERELEPFEREATLKVVDDPPTPCLQTDLYLRGRAPCPYRATVALWDDAYFAIDFEPAPAASLLARIFELSDALADTFHPDWGAAGVSRDLRDDLTRALANDDERDVDQLNGAMGLFRSDYIRRGPHGLAPRTYIGPFFAEQFGRDRIESLPLEVEKLVWGGYRVDLVPEPWLADVPVLLERWRRGMAHLLAANIFPVPVIDPGYATRWKRGASVRLRP